MKVVPNSPCSSRLDILSPSRLQLSLCGLALFLSTNLQAHHHKPQKKILKKPSSSSSSSSFSSSSQANFFSEKTIIIFVFFWLPSIEEVRKQKMVASANTEIKPQNLQTIQQQKAKD
jgi:hypothetical protein